MKVTQLKNLLLIALEKD